MPRSFSKCSTKKPGIEIAVHHLRREVVENPALRGALADRAEHRLEIEPRLVAVEQALAHADDRAREHDLIAHLRVLSVAGAALVHDVLAHRLEERHDAIDRVLVAADHDRERRVSRADVAARDRRVDGGYALRLRRLVNLAREARLGGRHVDDDAAFLDGVENAALLLIDLAHIARQSDDREDDVGSLGDRARRVGPHRALVEQALRPRLGAAVNRGRDSPWPSGGRTSTAPMTPVPIHPIRVSLMSAPGPAKAGTTNRYQHHYLEIDRPRPHFAARAAVAPPDDAAVRETLDLLNFSAAWTGQRMRQIARAPPAARYRAAIVLIRVAAILMSSMLR